MVTALRFEYCTPYVLCGDKISVHHYTLTCIQQQPPPPHLLANPSYFTVCCCTAHYYYYKVCRRSNCQLSVCLSLSLSPKTLLLLIPWGPRTNKTTHRQRHTCSNNSNARNLFSPANVIIILIILTARTHNGYVSVSLHRRPPAFPQTFRTASQIKHASMPR